MLVTRYEHLVGRMRKRRKRRRRRRRRRRKKANNTSVEIRLRSREKFSRPNILIWHQSTEHTFTPRAMEPVTSF